MNTPVQDEQAAQCKPAGCNASAEKVICVYHVVLVGPAGLLLV